MRLSPKQKAYWREAGHRWNVKHGATRSGKTYLDYFIIPFSFITKTPPAAVLIKKAAGINTASGKPNKEKVATLTAAQVEEIAKTKMPDLNAASLEAACSMVRGTCRSMGIVVEG